MPTRKVSISQIERINISRRLRKVTLYCIEFSTDEPIEIQLNAHAWNTIRGLFSHGPAHKKTPPADQTNR
jgi:hypothetical protein